MSPSLLAVVAAGVFVLAVFLLSYGHRSTLLTLLVGVSAGLVAVQGANIHLFTALTTLWWLLTPRPAGRPQWAGWLVVAGVVPVALTALTGDLVNNPLLSLQLLALSINAAMIVSRSTRESSELMLRGLLIACTAASFMSLGQVAGVFPNEGFHTDIIAAGRPYAFYPEPDWAGLFSTIGVVLAFRTMRLRSILFSVVMGLNVVGSALAAARASWVALMACLVVFLLVGLISKRTRIHRPGRVQAVVLVALAGSAALLVFPDIREELAKRLFTLVQPNTATDISGRARVQQTDGLRRLGESAPWFGHGISASGRVGVSGRYISNSANSLGSNWVLALWVDAQYLAIPFLLLTVGVALRAARSIAGQLLVLLCVHNLFTNATVQPIMWLVLGLAWYSVTQPRVSGPTGDQTAPVGVKPSHPQPTAFLLPRPGS